MSEQPLPPGFTGGSVVIDEPNHSPAPAPTPTPAEPATDDAKRK